MNEMNKVILIGNGFDLAHGLKTRYSDFILWYLNKVLKKARETHYKYEDDLLRVQYSRTIMLNEFSTITDLFKTINANDINISYKHMFIKKLVDLSYVVNWVDIESRYYSELIDLYRKLEKLNIDNHKNIDANLIELNKCFEFIKIELIEYLSLIDKNDKIKNEEINNLFLGHFGINENNQNNQKGLFINFNYTSTVDLYIKTDNSTSIMINNIHGRLNEKSNPIIFGYGDEMDTYYEKIERLNSNEFLRNIKSFWYFKTKNYQNVIDFLHQGPFNVYILGHSCGLSDRILLNSIFEHSHCNKIKIYYHQKNKDENDYFEKTQEISRHFKPANKAKMRNSIIPFPESLPLVPYKS
jgi:hypothetical protein